MKKLIGLLSAVSLLGLSVVSSEAAPGMMNMHMKRHGHSMHHMHRGHMKMHRMHTRHMMRGMRPKRGTAVGVSNNARGVDGSAARTFNGTR